MIQIIVNNKEPRNLNIEPIWLDDTASMVKQKLSAGLKCSIEELYLFVQSTTTLSPQIVYSTLLKNKKQGVSQQSVRNFCENIRNPTHILEEIEKLEDPESPIPYEFFERVFRDEMQVNVPFGVSFNPEPLTTGSNSTNMFMAANPFTAKRIKSNQFVVLSTNEETILSKLPNIYSNPTLFVCTATEVIESIRPSERQNINIGETVSLYFPKLSAKLPQRLSTTATADVADYLDAIGVVKKDLSKQSEGLFKTNAKYYQNINFWNMQGEEVPGIDPAAIGITSLTATYLSTPSITYPLPIDYIFKSIHATERMPFVRHIISKRREQMIRLYAPEEAEDDKRIPYLPRALVNKIITKSKKTPGIGVFVAGPSPDIYIFLELKETGEIQVHLETPDNKPYAMSQLESIGEIIAEFVGIVNEILKQTDIVLTPVTNVMSQMSITSVDWILPFQVLNQKKIFSQAKAKLGSSVFLSDAVFSKEQGKREKDKGPAKTKEKAAKQKTEMSFVYTRVSNFSVDMPEEFQTTMRLFYSVDAHRLYMKVSNLPQIKYLQTVPKYAITFMNILTNKDLEEEFKSGVEMSTFGYHKQKGEEELQALLFEEMREKEAKAEASTEMEEDEEDELQKFIAARMVDIPESPERVEEEEEDLGEFGLDEDEDNEEEDFGKQYKVEEEDELGDFDEEL